MHSKKYKNLVLIKIYFLLLTPMLFGQNKSIDNFFEKSDTFFKHYVSNGLVDYDAIYSDKTEINELIKIISGINIDELNDPVTKKAFLINAYNLYVINEIAKRKNVNSPESIPGFFNYIKHRIGNNEYSLDEIEKQLLFKEYQDARLHFVLVCAAISCPEIVNHAYKPYKLDSVLNAKAVSTLNDTKHVKVNNQTKTIYLSKIFDWYADDFSKNGKSVIDFINTYRKNKLDKNYSIEYMPYNWSLNKLSKQSTIDLQNLSPSALLPVGESEIKIFNNLYTQTSYYNSETEKIEQGNRSNFLTSIIAATYGLNSSINLGIDAWFRSSSEISEASSPFSLFGFNANRQRTAISRIGPRIKFVPFNSGVLNNVSVQSSFLIPTVSNLSGTDKYFYLDDDAYLFINQFLYDVALKNDISLYVEFAVWMKLNRDNLFDNINYNVPLKFFVNYYATHKLTLYAMNEFNFGFNSFNNSYFNQTGFGAKYLLLQNLELEGLITKFLFGKNSGAGTTFNLGIRIIY